MKTTAQDHLNAIFKGQGSPLQKIFAAYEAHQSLSRLFNKTLPDTYKNQVEFLLYQGGIMTVSVNNSATLARMNYLKGELLDLFKKQPEWAGLREIKVKMLV